MNFKPLVLVEDVKMCAKLLAKSLNDCNVDADCVYDGIEALDAIKGNKSKYSMVFTDIRMSVMGGRELIENLRLLGYKEPMIAITSDTLSDDRQEIVHKGADEVLCKPVKLQILRQVLIRHKIIDYTAECHTKI